MFPGIAIAKEIQRRHPNAAIRFVGTGRGIESRVVPAEGFDLSLITVSGLRGIHGLRRLRALWSIPGSLWQSYKILRSFRPNLVLGVGGYSSGPPVLMAALMRIPILLQEQNALPGITNRLMSRLSRKVATAFDECHGFFGEKAVLTGNPVRAGFLQKTPRLVMDRFVVLIFGGSQGARAINQAMVKALEYLKDLLPSLWFIHQTGESDQEEVGKAYEQAGAQGEVRPFFDDMPLQFSRADLIICRSGAMAVAELTVAGKAAILIPYPSAVDNHQQKNAEALVRAGAAQMILQSSLSGKELADRIRYFVGDRASLRLMEQKSRELGRPDSTQRIVDLAEELIHV